MESGILKLLRIPETRKKITFTLGILLVYRLGFQVPLPGMSPEFLTKMAEGMQGSVFGVMNAFSGGAIGQTAIFGLGIMPYISASIIFSMLAKVSPRIEAVAKEGAAGQKKINHWTRLATVPIAMIQAIFVYTGVFQGSEEMLAPGVDPGFSLFLRVMLGLTAGALFVMWLGEQITEHGIGNGASLLIMANIIASMPASIAAMAGNDEFYTSMVSLIFLWIVIVVAIVYITKGARRIPMQYARLTRGRRVYGGQRHYLPLKINMAGVMPIIFASILFVVPGLLFTAVGMPALRNVFSDQRGFLYIVLYSGLIFAFCFFWNRLMFQPEEIAKDLRERGAFIPGIRPGARTAEFLDHTLTRITLAGAAFLAVIAILPGFVTAGSGLDQNLAYFLGGTSVLIVVGVAMDVVDKLNAQLVMRNYEGFMKGGTGGSAWGKKGA
jgi:preprotein translocase subunit SecY